MFGKSDQFWEYFVEWRTVAFFLAGILWVVNLTFHLLPDLLPQLIVILGTYSGTVALGLGLVGFYPELKGPTPRIALAGVLLAGFSIVLLLVLPVALTGIAVPLGAEFSRLSEIGLRGASVSLVAFVILVPVSAILLGYATLRSRVHPNAIGYLLLAFAVPWLALLSHGLFDTPFPTDWMFSLFVALVPLLIGYTLLMEDRQLPRALS